MNWRHLKHLDDDLKVAVVLWNKYRWERAKVQYEGELDKQDLAEMVRLYNADRPIFEMLDQDDYSVKSFDSSLYPVVDRAFIRRRCCGVYQLQRGEDYLRRLG